MQHAVVLAVALHALFALQNVEARQAIQWGCTVLNDILSFGDGHKRLL